MATTAAQETEGRRRDSAWQGFQHGSLAEARSTSATSSSRTTRRTTATQSFLAPATDAHARRSGNKLNDAVRRGAQEGRARRLPDSELDHRARARATSTATTKSSSGCRPRRRSSARSCRTAASAWSLNALKTYGYEPDPHVVEAFTKYRKTHNEGGLRRLHRRHPALPQLAHPDRPARRLRPRPDHRRLPARRALRRGPADRAQAGGEERPRRRACRPTRSSATARS